MAMRTLPYDILICRVYLSAIAYSGPGDGMCVCRLHPIPMVPRYISTIIVVMTSRNRQVLTVKFCVGELIVGRVVGFLQFFMICLFSRGC